MNQSKLIKLLSAFLVLVMVLGLIPVSSLAAVTVPSSMTLVSQKESALAPGVTETEVTVLDKNGDRVRYFVVNAEVATNPDVQVKANYHDNDNTGVWGKATVVEQANAATEKRGYNVVASVNASYYNVSTGQPTGGFVMEGVNINGNSAGNSYPFFAVLKDGTAMIGQKGTFSNYADDVQEAVGGWTMLVWDGEVVATNDTNKYPRSTVGVTADGNVILMQADGNQAPFSIGLTLVEQAQVMLELGCVAAVELDGGGSATYAAKLEGTDEIVVRNSCCDGAVRSVSNTLMVISTAVADGTFDHANLSTGYQYYAPYSQVTIDAIGADAAGGAAEIPADVAWRLADDQFGTIENGVFTSNGTTGEVTAEMVYNEETIGSVTFAVVDPDAIAFDAEEKSIPYGKTTALSVSATYGLNDVYLGVDALDITLSDNDAAAVDGAMFTAAPEASGKAGVTVTATYKYADIASTSVYYKFGKESTVLVDFEDGDASNWTTDFNVAKDAFSDKTLNDVPNSSNGIEDGLVTNSYISDEYAKTGDKSLAVNIDYTQSESFGNWMYMYLYYLGDTMVYRDVENGVLGTRLGMWMYIPEEAVGMCARLCYTFDNNGTKNGNYLYLTYQYVSKGFSKLTSATIPEAGWAYVYVDFFDTNTAGCGGDYFSSLEYGSATNNKGASGDYFPAFIQFIASSSYTGCENMTFYIDDITLDYGDVTPDRDAPVISDMKVYSADGLTSATLNNNTLAFNQITVNAAIAEDYSHAAANATGLDLTTAQVYVDGQKVATNVVNGIMSSSAVTLPDGVHDITFEVADNTGNYTKITKQITIAAGTDYPTVTLTGSASTEGNILSGSIYNMFLNVDQVEKIQSVSTTIHLGSAFEFETEGLTVLNGFTATTSVDEAARTLTITVERTGKSDLTGAATLATIPARMWYWNAERTGISAIDQWNGVNGGGACTPVLTFNYKIWAGSVSYVDGYTVEDAAYVPGFSNMKASLTTELNTGIGNLKSSGLYWHVHEDYKDTWVTESVDATCTENGYTDRVTCTKCNSVIHWGTVYATGHSYELVDGVYGCACGEKFNGEENGVLYVDGVAAAGWIGESYYVDGVKLTGVQLIDGIYYDLGDDGISTGAYTGLMTIDDALYYVQLGEFASGWNYIDGYYYFFSRTTYKAYNGVANVDGHIYEFEDYKLVTGDLVVTEDGIKYYWAGKLAPNGWTTIKGNTYYIYKGYAFTGIHAIDSSRYAGDLRYYMFGDDGVLICMLDGLYDGVYYKEGEKIPYLGLVKFEGNYYYVNDNACVVTNTTRYVKTTNGLTWSDGTAIAQGYYTFDADGKLVIKHGADADGYFYINGAKQKAYQLIQDDNGDFYFIGDYHKYITNKTQYLSSARLEGTGFSAGYYEFGADGKMIIKNGANADGFFYVNGTKAKAYQLIQDANGDFYFIGDYHKYITNKTQYLSSARLEGTGLQAGYYEFGADGKMIIKNGANADGFFYVNGTKAKAYQLIQDANGDFYFIGDYHKYITNKTQYLSAARVEGTGLTAGYYYFGADGKLVIE